MPRFAIHLIRSACADGKLDAIAELATSVENALRQRQRQVKEGAAMPVVFGGAIADSEASNYAYRLVKACHAHGHPPPKELVLLLQTLLAQDRPPGGTGHRQRTDSGWLAKAATYWHDNPDTTKAELARVVGVHRGTIGKAIKSGKLPLPIVADNKVH